jgi:hypothetical protein
MPELHSLSSAGKSVQKVYRAGPQPKDISVPQTETPATNVFPSDDDDAWQPAGYYRMEVWAMELYIAEYLGCCDDPHHSATRLLKWSPNWTWLGIFDSCNHGACPGTSSMGIKAATDTRYKPGFSLQACNETQYDVFSDSGHNCHDDTRVQLANFMYGNGHNKPPGQEFWCDDGDSNTDISCHLRSLFCWGDHDGYPSISETKKRGYLHPDMCRAQGLNSWNYYAACECGSWCVQYDNCCIDVDVVQSFGDIYSTSFESEYDFPGNWGVWHNCAADGNWTAFRANYPAPDGGLKNVRLHSTEFKSNCNWPGIYAQSPSIDAEPGLTYRLNLWARHGGSNAHTAILFFGPDGNLLGQVYQNLPKDPWAYREPPETVATSPANTAYFQFRVGLTSPKAYLDVDRVEVFVE